MRQLPWISSLIIQDPRVALLQFGQFCDRLSSAWTNTSLLSQSYIIVGYTAYTFSLAPILIYLMLFFLFCFHCRNWQLHGFYPRYRGEPWLFWQTIRTRQRLEYLRGRTWHDHTVPVGWGPDREVLLICFVKKKINSKSFLDRHGPCNHKCWC